MKRLEELGISPAPWKMDYDGAIDVVVNVFDANNKVIVETTTEFILLNCQTPVSSEHRRNSTRRYTTSSGSREIVCRRNRRPMKIEALRNAEAALAEASGESEVKK